MNLYFRQASIRSDNINSRKRKGAIIVLAAALLIIVLTMTAFSIDLGYIAVTKAQMRSAADAAALAAAIELPDGLGMAPTKTATGVTSSADAAAVAIAALQRNGDQSSTLIRATRDVQFGQVTWDSSTRKWTKTWGTPPYNLVGVTVHRDGTDGSGADSRLPLLFAPAIGYQETGMTAVANAALLPGVGVKVGAGSALTAGILPIAFDDSSWTELCAGTSDATIGVGGDNYAYDPATGTVSPGSDGVQEASLYPTSTGSPGNRGTVNIGTTNNSTSNLQRQILYGLSASDLAPYGGELRTDNGPILLAGNPGISAAIKSSLSTIIGQPRLIPIFTNLTGNGANAEYTISKFVGVRVLYVELTGGNKKVVIQPAFYSSHTVIPGSVPLTQATYWTKPKLTQ